MTNPTMQKFGYPRSAVAEHGPWVVLVRPKQVTLGSLVLVCREPEQAFGDLSATAFTHLKGAVAGVERTLKAFVDYERINHLMLMMVDPDVHFHVIPRYEGARSFDDLTLPDARWPGPPDLNSGVELDDARIDAMVAKLKSLWTGS